LTRISGCQPDAVIARNSLGDASPRSVTTSTAQPVPQSAQQVFPGLVPGTLGAGGLDGPGDGQAVALVQGCGARYPVSVGQAGRVEGEYQALVGVATGDPPQQRAEAERGVEGGAGTAASGAAGQVEFAEPGAEDVVAEGEQPGEAGDDGGQSAGTGQGHAEAVGGEVVGVMALQVGEGGAPGRAIGRMRARGTRECS
jgi:hypothetical protein